MAIAVLALCAEADGGGDRACDRRRGGPRPEETRQAQRTQERDLPGPTCKAAVPRGAICTLPYARVGGWVIRGQLGDSVEPCSAAWGRGRSSGEVPLPPPCPPRYSCYHRFTAWGSKAALVSERRGEAAGEGSGAGVPVAGAVCACLLSICICIYMGIRPSAEPMARVRGASVHACMHACMHMQPWVGAHSACTSCSRQHRSSACRAASEDAPAASPAS